MKREGKTTTFKESISQAVTATETEVAQLQSMRSQVTELLSREPNNHRIIVISHYLGTILESCLLNRERYCRVNEFYEKHVSGLTIETDIERLFQCSEDEGSDLRLRNLHC